MKKIKAVIVDDEQHALDALDIQIARCNADVEVLAKFSNPEEAVRYLKTMRSIYYSWISKCQG